MENYNNVMPGSIIPGEFKPKKLKTGKIALFDADRVKYIIPDRIFKRLEEDEKQGKSHIYLKEDILVTEVKKYLAEWFDIIDDPILFCFSDKSSSVFRSHLASEKKYKGNRDNVKPYREYEDKHLHSIKAAEYIMQNYASAFEEGLEADDIICALQSDDTYVVSNDKDLKQIAGWHFDESKVNIYEVSGEESLRHIAYQLICGDSTDNIPGLPRKGDKFANSFLSNKEINPKFFLHEILTLYQKHYKSVTLGTDAFVENYQLIRLKTDRGEHFKNKYRRIFDTKEALLRTLK